MDEDTAASDFAHTLAHFDSVCKDTRTLFKNSECQDAAREFVLAYIRHCRARLHKSPTCIRTLHEFEDECHRPAIERKRRVAWVASILAIIIYLGGLVLLVVGTVLDPHHLTTQFTYVAGGRFEWRHQWPQGQINFMLVLFLGAVVRVRHFFQYYRKFTLKEPASAHRFYSYLAWVELGTLQAASVGYMYTRAGVDDLLTWISVVSLAVLAAACMAAGEMFEYSARNSRTHVFFGISQPGQVMTALGTACWLVLVAASIHHTLDFLTPLQRTIHFTVLTLLVLGTAFRQHLLLYLQAHVSSLAAFHAILQLLLVSVTLSVLYVFY